MTRPSNALLARFDSMPCFIEAGLESRVETALNAVVGHERANELLATVATATGDTFWYPADDWRACFRPYVVSNGILQIPVADRDRIAALGFWGLDD